MQLATILLLAAAPATSWAQDGGAPPPPPPPAGTQPPPAAMPVPGELELAKLIWTTIAAVDHANQSGNYSVLRDLASPAFQIANDPARLTAIFAGLRASNIDLSNTLLLAPTYRAAPQVLPGNLLRIQGAFGLRPTQILFDLEYQWVAGKWRLYGVSISPLSMAGQMPGAPVVPGGPVVPDSRRRGGS